MISKAFAWLYLWFHNYCPKHVEEKQFSGFAGLECPTCEAEKKARFQANVEYAGKILRS